MQKILKAFSYTVIAVFLLALFGWMSVEISKGSRSFGFLDEPIRTMTTFPDLFKQSVKEVKTLPETFIKTADDFQTINKLDTSILVLTTYSDVNDTRTIALMDLKTDQVLKSWTVENPFLPTDRIINPIMLPDSGLIYAFQGKNLQRIDKDGNLIWKQDSMVAHHSMTLDADSNIWVCSFENTFQANGLYYIDRKEIFFKDNFITQLDAETGEVLFHKSMAELLGENNLGNYLLKSMTIADPLHNNDVQPALKTTEFYQKGDVFVSMKNPSFIIHYRPSENKLVDIIEGPFISQHDVDFYDENTLVIFNNNDYEGWTSKGMDVPKTQKAYQIGDFYSNIVAYNFPADSFYFIGDSIFRNQQIFTYTEGLQEFITPSMYFVEEQNSGKLWVIKDDEVVYKNVLRSQHEGYHHLPNWTRIIKQ